ncbi:hypothetical protein JCM11491_007034 [Sporobolomyces phaffii]
MTTLELQQAALPAPCSILATTLLGLPFVVATSKEAVHLLDESATLLTSISFRDAFPHLSDSESLDGISHTAVDVHTNRIVATLNSKLAVFEPIPSSTSSSMGPLQRWRVHSSFTALHGKIESVDFVRDTIAVQTGPHVVVYSLVEDYALPSWKPIATLPFSLPISHLRLEVSPSNERILAALPRGSSSCLIFDLAPPSPASPSTSREAALDFEFSLRSRAVHSIRLKSIDWRKTSSSGSDSGPVLMTTTIQNKIHLWGCVIDEPKQFSLWITLPSPPPPPPPPVASRPPTTAPVPSIPARSSATTVRSPLVPLDHNNRTGSSGSPLTDESTFDDRTDAPRSVKRLRTLWSGYWKTRECRSLATSTTGQDKSGNEDLFWSLLEDGRFYLTVVSNLDSRPPTCLTSQTTLASSTTAVATTTIPRDQLAYFRHTFLLPSRSEPEATIHLVSRSSWSALLHTRLSLSSIRPSPNDDASYSVSRVQLLKPAVNYVGHVRKLVRTFPAGESFLVLGTPERSGTTHGRIQSWFPLAAAAGGISSREESVMDLDGRDDGKKRVASWLGGTRIVVGKGNQLSVYSRPPDEGRGMERLTVEEFAGIDFDDAKAFFVARRSEDDLQTWIVAVTKVARPDSATTTREYDYRIDSWIYHAPSRRIFPGAPSHAISTSSATCSKSATIVWVSIVPPRPGSVDSTVIDRIEVESVDSEGCVRTWTLDLAREDPKWSGGKGFKTGKKGVRRSSSRGNGVVALATDDELSIWNERNHEFGNSLKFSFPLEEKTVSLEFSIDTNLLALASPTNVALFVPTRRTADSPYRWARIATVTPVTPSPITSVQFHASGLAIACQEQLFFHSFELARSKIDRRGERYRVTRDIETELVDKNQSLRLTDGALLKKLIEFGHFETVRRFFILLARELDEDGRVIERVGSTTPVSTPFGAKQVLDDLESRRKRRKRDDQKLSKGDVVAALSTASAERTRTEEMMTDSDRSRLVAACSNGSSLRGISKEQQRELAPLVQTVYDIQSKLHSVDDFGMRYLSAIRSLANTDPSSVTLVRRAESRAQLAPRDLLFAHHSKSQRVLLDRVIDSVGAGGKMSWENAKSFGIPIWVRDRDQLLETMEVVGRTSFLLDPDNRDPILPMLFYLALRKLPQVYTFWKQSLGHGDQRQMLKFLSNDFDQERWRVAARKNAFALLSKRRFLFAAAFFLLGDSLSDCVSVLLRHLQDPLLAIAIARTYELDQNGPVLRNVLEQTVLPTALRDGDRFTSCWALETLGERDSSVRVLIESLPLIDSPKLDQVVENPLNEDPARIVFFEHLRESASTVEEAAETRFVLYTARQLCEAGCHVLALDLVRSYPYRLRRSSSVLPKPSKAAPSATETTDVLPAVVEKRPPTNFVEPDTSSLFDMMMPSPAPTRAPLTAATHAPVAAVAAPEAEADAEDETERQKRLFREATGAKPKVETKNTVEAFSFDAFGF